MATDKIEIQKINEDVVFEINLYGWEVLITDEHGERIPNFEVEQLWLDFNVNGFVIAKVRLLGWNIESEKLEQAKTVTKLIFQSQPAEDNNKNKFYFELNRVTPEFEQFYLQGEDANAGDHITEKGTI